MCDLVPFVQFKKREEHPWWSVIFSKVAVILKGYYAATIYLSEVRLSFYFSPNFETFYWDYVIVLLK